MNYFLFKEQILYSMMYQTDVFSYLYLLYANVALKSKENFWFDTFHTV